MATDSSSPPPAHIDDELDQELLRLTPRLRRPRPVIAAALLVFTAYLAWWLRDDLRYSLSAKTPRELGTVASALAPSAGLADDTYVALQARPLHPAEVMLEQRGSSSVHLLAPVAGAGDRLLLDLDGTPPSTEALLSGRVAGRLRRLDRVGYGDEVRQYFERMRLPRYLRPIDLLDAIAASRRSLQDEAGDPVDLDPATALSLTVRLPEDAILSLDAGRFSSSEAQALLGRVVVAVGGAAVTEPTPSEGGERLDYVVRVPGGLVGESAHALEKLLAPYAGAARLRPRTADLDLPVGHLEVDAERGLFLVTSADLPLDERPASYVAGAPGSAPAALAPASAPIAELRPLPPAARLEIRLADVERARLLSPARLPAETWVLGEGDAPARYWYVPPVYGLLLLVAIFNLLALRAGLRRRVAPLQPESTSAPSAP